MNNRWYNQVAGGMPQPQAPMNPMQRVQMVMQAMRNPAQVVKKAFPDIPDEMMNNPQQIMNYLQQTRNISNAQLQQITQMMPK